MDWGGEGDAVLMKNKILKFALVIVIFAVILIATAYLGGYFPVNKTTVPQVSGGTCGCQ